MMMLKDVFRPIGESWDYVSDIKRNTLGQIHWFVNVNHLHSPLSSANMGSPSSQVMKECQ